MNNSLLRTLLFLIICTLCLLVNQLHAQTIIREYNGNTFTDSTTVINGCGGVAIQFTISPVADHSYSNFSWSNVDNGVVQSPFSTLSNPFEQFNQTGLYGIQVEFDDTDAVLGTTTRRTLSSGATPGGATIVVFDQPEGSFYADQRGVCVGTTITLTQTTPGTFTSLAFLVDNRLYPFDPATENSVTVTLNNPGDFDVVLNGVTADGCQFIKRESNYLSVANPFSTSITASQTLSCAQTQTVTFTATSTDDIDGTAVSPEYTWDFGDGNTETTTMNTVTHTYDQVNGNDFTATVSPSLNGCSGTANNTIDIHFRDISTLYGAPVITGECDEYILTYTPTASIPSGDPLKGVSVVWDFGDGSATETHDIEDVVTHTFSNATSNPLPVTITSRINATDVPDASCSFSDTQTVPILPQAGISITSNDLEYCSENFSVDIEAVNLQNVTNFYWILDGNTSSPIDNNITNTSIPISGYGNHTIELYYDAQTGDINDNCVLNSISVYSAPLTVSVSGPTEGCAPADSTFNSLVTWEDQSGNTVTNPFSVDSEVWTVTNTITSVVTTYNSNPLTFSNLDHGTYEITYGVTLDAIGSNSACQFTSNPYTFMVGQTYHNPPIVVNPSTICIGTTVNFSTPILTPTERANLGISPDYDIIYQYKYSSIFDWTTVGTGGIGSYYYGDIVDDNRTALPGVFQVQLRAVINGCPGLPSTIHINIEPSEAEHEVTTNECTPTRFTYVNNSLGTSSTVYQWHLTIDPPGADPAVSWSSPTTTDENYDMFADGTFPTFTGYSQGEIPENSRIDITIDANEPGNGCSDSEDTTFFMPGPLPQLNPTPFTSTGTCINDVLQFDAGDGGVGDSLYLWTFTNTSDPSIVFSFSTDDNSIVDTSFPIPGQYNGTLDVTTEANCTFSTTFGPIQITGGSVNINGPTNGCLGDSFTFQGINVMYSPNSPTYEWYIDDSTSVGTPYATGTATGGVIPDLVIPNTYFTSANNPQSIPHSVTLVLTVNGCPASYTHYITVTEPDFSLATVNDHISFDYLCDEIITIVDLDLDDSEVYNLSSATIRHSISGSPVTPNSQTDDVARFSLSAGTYTMAVEVEDEFGCSSTENITFTVPTMQELEADFTPNSVNLTCPGFVSFNDNADETAGNTTRREDYNGSNVLEEVAITTWQWDFDNDGTIDATTTVGNVAHYYDRPGMYDAVVTVTDAHGCQDTSDPITIEVGGTSGTYEILKKIGFEPATTRMEAFPVDDPNTNINNTIYQWSSGDGQLGTNMIQEFTYSSTIGGANMSTITPNLTFLDENGCSYPADYSGDMTILRCPDIANDDITLCTDQGPYTLNVEDMSWNGSFTATDVIETSDYIYSWTLEYQWLVDGTVVAQVDGGNNPEVTFSFGPDDTNPFVINPDDADGKLYTIQATIMATYVDKHDATNNLSAHAECVMTDDIRVIYNPTPIAAFTHDQVCDGFATTLDASTTAFGIYTRGNITNYQWDIDNDGAFDFNSSNPISTYTFPNQGIYPVTLRVSSGDGCFDQVTESSVIVDAVPTGDYVYNNVCESYEIQFTDRTSITPVTDDAIVRWDWDFNNNGTFDLGGTDPAVHQNPLIDFSTFTDGNGSNFPVDAVLRPLLRVTTNKGCTYDYLPSMDDLLVFSFREPVANLTAERQLDNLANEVCLGQIMSFTGSGSTVDNSNLVTFIPGLLDADVNDIVTWAWDFGDGNNSSQTDPVHTYSAIGTYTVQLTVTTARGCTDTNTITVHVRETPDPDIGVSDIDVCDDQTIQLRPVENSVAGFTYTWTEITSSTTGSITSNNLNSHTATLDVDEVDFNPGESLIEATYQLQIVDNNHPTACDTTDQVNIEFHRSPNIALDTSLVSCGTVAEYVARPFGTEIIPGFTYLWTQDYLTGGTVTTTNTALQDFTVNTPVYNDGSTRIMGKYFIDVTNALSCTDRDQIEFTMFREPDFSDAEIISAQCNSSNRDLYEVTIEPFDDEVLPHNAGFDYTWSMTNIVADHNVDPTFLNDIVTQVTTNANTQNLSLDILDSYFVDNTVDLSFTVDLRVENTYDNTCFSTTSFLVEIERRPSDFTVSDTRGNVCDLSVTLNHHTETLGFNYRWLPTSVTNGFDGSVSDIATTNNQARTLTFTDADFATGASEFTLDINHRIRKNADPSDPAITADASPACGINKDISLTFYRTPNIVFTDVWPGGDNCANNMMITSGSEVIPGFTYNWVQTSVVNGTVNHDATNNRDINLSVGSWDTNETVITVTYLLMVQNTNSITCQDIQTHVVQFHRTPELDYTEDPQDCTLTDTVSVGNEALNGATFTWIPNNAATTTLITDGHLVTDDSRSGEFDITASSFPSNAHRIDAQFNVNISNSTASNCDDDTTFNITFYRTPDINFSAFPADSCLLTRTLEPFGGETIAGYNYQWTQLSSSGGTISTSSLTGQDLTVTADAFDLYSTRIQVAFQLDVVNSNAMGCSDSEIIYFNFYRTPDFTASVEEMPSDQCGLEIDLYPLGKTEVINHNNGYNYTWSLGTAAITGAGADGSTLPATILNEINTNQVNDQNLNLTMPLSAFANGSNEITFEVDVLIENSASGVSCSNTKTYALSFKRPPVVAMVEDKANSCALSATLKPFGTETINGFLYEWTVTSITNYTGSTYSASNTFNTQDLAVSLTDADFTPTESKIVMDVSLVVRNALASTNASCITTETHTLTFYRTPTINTPFLSTKVSNCDHTATSEPFATNVNGYSYVWSKVSENGGTVSNSDLTQRQITVDLDGFDTNSLQVNAQYQLRVFNTENPDCEDIEPVNFEFYRTPEIEFDDPMSMCSTIGSDMTFRSINEAFINNGETFTWNQTNTTPGGTINETYPSLGEFNIEVASFDNNSNRIDLTYNVSISNSSSHTCDDDTTFNVTFFRTPEINFLTTRTDSCTLNETVQAFNGENVPGFDRSWRLVNVTGGNIKYTSDGSNTALNVNNITTDDDLSISVLSFDLNSTTITVEYELTAVNEDDNTCTDTDRIFIYFYRTPDINNPPFVQNQPTGECGNTINVNPLGPTEVINHNNGFDYVWTLDPSSVSGAIADGGSDISIAVDNYLNNNINSQDLSVQVHDSVFATGAHILSFNMDLTVSHSNTAITCATDSRNILFQYYRYPEINFVEDKSDSCALTTTVQPFNTEVIPGYNYAWKITDIRGYDGSTYTVNSNYSTQQNLTFTVTDNDFIDTESVISIDLELTAVNSEAPADNSCKNVQTYTVNFYRTPEIKSNFLSTKLYACDDEGVASPFNTHVNGYIYQWVLDSMSTKNGQVSGVVTDDSHLGNRELNVQIDSFTDLHSIMRAHYKLRVINSNQPTCFDEDTVSFSFYRTPEVMLTSMTGPCQNAVMVTSTNEMLLDVDFDWTLITQTGGIVTTDPANHDGNRQITFTATDYNSGESEINSTYMITLLNSGESMCDDDTTFSFTLYRHPEIDFTYTRASNDSCSNALTIIPFNNEDISGFENTWQPISGTLSGGNITTSTNTNDENLTVTLDTFATNSTRIDVQYTLSSENRNSTACIDKDTIAVTLFREPDFTNFGSATPNGVCGLEMTLYPLGTNETIAHNTGFDYVWSYDSLNVTGAANNILPLTVINSFYTQVNNQNLNITLPLEAFADGSNKIEIPVTITMDNSDQSGVCTNAYNHTMVFYRPPVIDFSQTVTACETTNTITPFGTENLSSAFTFNWSYTTVGGSVTNTSLSNQDITFNNPVFNNGSDTVRVIADLTVSNNENTNCQDTERKVFVFYRTPDINFAQSITNCDDTNLITSFGSETLNGYSYNWSEVSVTGGTIGISAPFTVNDQNIQFEETSFSSGSHKIDVEYQLTVANSDTLGIEQCNDVDNVSFTFLRTPAISIAQTLTVGDCDSINTVTTFGTEQITGFTYEWTMQSVVGGTVDISATNTQDVTFNNPVFNNASNQIDVTYQVTVRNSENPTSCFDSETFNFTFYRTPNIDFTISRVSNDSCTTALTIIPYNNEGISDYTNTWTQVGSSLSGGTITTSTNSNDENLTITLGNFADNSTRIDVQYQLMSTNTNASGCTDTDVYSATLFRQPDFTNFLETRADGNCGLQMSLLPLGSTEAIAHNTGFDYMWSYNSANFTGVRASELQGILDDIDGQINNQNLNITLPLEAFANGSNKIEIPVTITIDNSDQSGVCTNAYNHTMVFYRPPVIDFSQTVTACETTNTITPFGAENLSSAFTFNWSYTTVGGSVTNSSLTNQDITFNNPVFDNGSDTVRVIADLTVFNNENTTCQDTERKVFVFYRTPDINFVQSITNCDDTNLITSFGSETLNGYSYNWSEVSVTGGTIGISTPFTVNDQNIQFEETSFSSGSHKIDVEYQLTVANSDTLGIEQCNDVDNVSFTFLRTPAISIAQTLTAGDCDSINTVTTFGTELIAGFTYEWTMQSVVGGTVDISATNTQDVTFNNPVFNNASNQIDVTYQVTVRNSENPTSCFDSETFNFTFYRTPNIDFTISRVSNDSCATALKIIPYNNEGISDYTNTWTQVGGSLSGGTITTSTNSNDENLTITLGNFADNSTRIDVQYQLMSTNTNASGCTDTDVFSATLFRQPDFTNFLETRADGNCGLQMSLLPLGSTEAIAHNTGFDYVWSYNSANFTGVRASELQGILDDIDGQINNQNLNITLPLEAFADGSNKIEIPVTITIDNSDQSGVCTNAYNHTMVFYRPPVIDFSQTVTACETTNTITPFGTENLSSAFTFNWSYTTVGGSVTNTSLSNQDITFNNPVFDNGSDTVRVIADLTVFNNENTTCQDTERKVFVFYRTPDINFVQSLTSCGTVNLIKPFGNENFTGYRYLWNEVSVVGGQLTLNSPYSLSSQNIELEKTSYDQGSHKIDVDYQLTVTNSDTLGVDQCNDIQNVQFTILRIPEIQIQQSLSIGNCGNVNTVTTFGTEDIPGYLYEWNMQSVVGGTVNISSTTTQNVTFDTPTFNSTSNQIDVTYQVIVRNSENPSTCFDTETVSFTFFRTPDATLMSINDVCSSSSILLSTSEDYVTNFTYLWRLIDSNTDHNPNSETLVAPATVQNENTYTLNSPVDIEGFFPNGSSQMTYEYEVTVENTLSNACADKDTIEATFFRVPILKSTQSLDSTNCETVNIIRPFGTEKIPNYTYAWEELTVSGGTINVSYLDTQQQDARFELATFDSLSHRVDVSYRLIVTNKDGACTGNETYNFTFFRTPQINLARLNIAPACMDSEVTLFPIDGDNDGFQYQWRAVSVVADNGTNLLASGITPVQSSLTDHTLTLKHNTSFPQNAVRVTSVYELTATNTDNNCSTTEQITVIFDRDALLALSANNFSTCDDTNLTLETIEPRTDNFDYTWTIDSIYTDNSASISTLSNINTSTSGSMTIDASPSDFPSGSALITAQFNVHAENQLNENCDADTAYTVTLARKPRINFTDTHSGCALDSVTIRSFGDEVIEGFNYNWSIASIDGYNGNANALLSSQQNAQNINVHFDDSDFSTGRSQIEVTFELTATNPHVGGCSDTQQHTLVFFRVPEIVFEFTKVGNDSCASEFTMKPFDEVVQDYQYEWTLLSAENGSATVVNTTTRDLVVNNPIFEQGETRIDLTYQLKVINSNMNASEPCITTEQMEVSFFKTPILNNTLLTADLGCNLSGNLKALTFPINTSNESNYVFEWNLNNVQGGTLDSTTTLDNLDLNVVEFAEGSGEVNVDIELDVHNAYQYNTCFSSKNEHLTFYRTPNITLTASATDLCETEQFTITTGEELVTEFDYNWTFNITDDINANTGEVDTLSNGSRGHELVLSNPTFPVGASYIDIEATLTVNNGSSGCTDVATTTVRFHKQPSLSIIRSNAFVCDDNTITLRPDQDKVFNFQYTWERLSLSTDLEDVVSGDVNISSLQDYEVTLQRPTFPEGSAQISSWYKLTVSNPNNPYCTEVTDSIEVTFFRSPITALGDDIQATCDSSSVTLKPSNEELITNFNYNWRVTRLDTDKATNDNRAQVEIVNGTTYSPTLSVTTIPDDASFVRAYITLETQNNLNACGTSTDEIVVTFLRTPTVTLPEDMADCQDRTFLLSPNETEWTGMEYEWEVVHATGGVISRENSMQSYLASLSAPNFTSSAFELNSKVVLRVRNKLDGSCEATDTIGITFHRTPIAEFTIDKGFGCQSEIIYFSTRNATVPPSGSTYEWDFDNDGTFEVTSLGDTSHVFDQIGTHPVNLRIISPAGCISETYTEPIHIYEIPTPSFTFNDICIGETASFTNTTPQLSVSGDHGVKAVKWDFDYNENNGPLFDAYNVDATYQYPAPGTYKVLVEVTNNGGCSNVYVDSITVTPLPVITMESDIWICEGLTTTITPEVDVPVTYQWSNDKNTSSITVGPLKETTYTLTVTNEQGCISSQDITVHVVPDVVTDFDLESCETVAITFDGRIPEYPGVIQTFEWSTGATTPTIDVLDNGTYTLRTIVEHESGTRCEFTHDYQATFHPNPERVLQDTTFCFEFGDLLQAEAVEGDNFTYQWDNGETTRVVTKDRSGVYTVIVTDETYPTRCTTVDTIVVNQICPARMNTPNAFTPNGDGINDEFLLVPAYAVDIELHIFNNWGESIFYRNYKTSFDAMEEGMGWDGTYKGSKMMSGNYTYTIRYTSQKDGSVTDVSGHVLLIR